MHVIRPTVLPRGRFLSVLLTVLTFLAGGVALASSASAHAHLLAVSPADGSAVRQSPGQVSLTFDEAVGRQFATIIVSNVGGVPVGSGPTQVNGAKVWQMLKPSLPAGVYTITFKVVSDDGHPVAGRSSFRVSGTGSGSATPGSATPGSATPGSATSGSPTTTASASSGPASASNSSSSSAVVAQRSPAATRGEPVGFWDASHLWGLVAVAVCILAGVGLLLRQRRARGH